MTGLREMRLTRRPHMDAAALKFDHTFGQREERVVLADADLEPGLEACSTLPNNDRTGLGGLASVELHAAELRVGIATVFGRTLTFFMSHGGAFREK